MSQALTFFAPTATETTGNTLIRRGRVNMAKLRPDKCEGSAGTTVRAPLWLTLLLMFVAIWLGTRIIHNTTEALMAMTTGSQAAYTSSAWPSR